MAHVVHQQLLGEPGLDAERVERLQEPAGLAVLVEVERVQHGAQAVQAEAGDAGVAQPGCPACAGAVVEEVEGGGLAAQRDDADPLGVLELLVAKPPLQGVLVELDVEEREPAVVVGVGGEPAEERLTVH